MAESCISLVALRVTVRLGAMDFFYYLGEALKVTATVLRRRAGLVAIFLSSTGLRIEGLIDLIESRPLCSSSERFILNDVGRRFLDDRSDFLPAECGRFEVSLSYRFIQ